MILGINIYEVKVNDIVIFATTESNFAHEKFQLLKMALGCDVTLAKSLKEINEKTGTTVSINCSFRKI